jgi:subtilisin family serine protease
MIQKIIIGGLIISLLCNLSLFSQSSYQKGDIALNKKTKYVPGQFIVKFKSSSPDNVVNSSALSRIVGTYSINKQEQIFSKARNQKLAEKLNLNNVFLMHTDKNADILQICRELMANPSIEYAEPNYISELDAIPNDPLYSSLYHLPQVEAPQAWDIQAGDSSVIIGVIDTGVDWDHEDLADVIWMNEVELNGTPGIDDDNNGYIDDIRGWDFVNTDGSNVWSGEDGQVEDNDPMDFHGHGTHVAGIAAAHTNNNIGIAAASWGARIMPLRIGWRTSDGNGLGTSLAMARAHIYAADNDAHITNLSFGNSGQTIVDAAFYAFLNNVLVVESAGNDNAVAPSSLGNKDFVMSVAALTSQDIKVSFSSFGEYVSVSAPGVSILSSIVHPSSFYGGSLYTNLSGTSMAAPLVASVAALVKQKEPGINVVDLYTRVQETADNIDALNPNFIGLLGAGRVNAYRALTESPVAFPKFNILSVKIDDSGGNMNGFIDPGEDVTAEIKLRNSWKNATGVNATLTGTNTWPLTITNGSSSWDNVSGVMDTANWEVTAFFDLSCDANALPKNVNLSLVLNADGGFTDTLDLNIAISPFILLVDDDDGSNNVEAFYTAVLDELGIGYDSWNHNSQGTPDSIAFNYPIIIWLCEWSFPSLDESDRDQITAYLDAGGRLFISGQDIGWDLADPSGADLDNQYGLSAGASNDFYNNYLKANYISDASNFNTLSGVNGDPIGDGLTFSVFQPGRTGTQQFPSEVAPINGSISIFNYPNANSGAVRFEENYRLVYFSFGGYEAITDSIVRQEVMLRVLNWLNGVILDHKPLQNSENTTEPYTVNAQITSSVDALESVTLLWDIDGQLPFNSVIMADQGGGIYSGDIPAQNDNTDIQYVIFGKTVNGTYPPLRYNTFHVGVDQIPPSVELVTEPQWNTVNAFGPDPYSFQIEASDNIGVDTTSVYIHFWVNSGVEDSVKMIYMGDGIFDGTFSFVSALGKDDMVNYFFKVLDSSSQKNVSQTQTYSYKVDTVEVVDDFEGDLFKWDLGDGWGTETPAQSGLYSITDSPTAVYQNNQNNPLTYQYSFNFSPFQSAWLEYYVRHVIETGNDSCTIEVSTDDGANWEILKSYSGNQVTFVKDGVDLSDYTNLGNENVKLRFRMISNESIPRLGIWIDDIVLNVSTDSILTSVDSEEILAVPSKFELHQNYPNPFNPSTEILFDIPARQEVDLVIFNVLGQKIYSLVTGVRKAGQHKVVWNGLDDNGQTVSSGIYFYQLKAKNFVKTRKMMYLR